MKAMKHLAFGIACICAATSPAATVSSADYVQSGLIAHWDAIDNVGTGVHDANATTWKDLTGLHADMVFPNGTLIGGNYYDMAKTGVSGGTGGYVTNIADIATAIMNKACTVEIVCDFRSQVEDGTLFCCYESTASKRILWVRSNKGGYTVDANGCIGAAEYCWSGGIGNNFKIDNGCLNEPRIYAIRCNGSAAKIYRNGIDTSKSISSSGLASVDASKAWFCIGRRYAASSPSAAVADMKIHAIRIYNRVLSDEEIAVNASLDAARFFSTDNKLHDASEYQQSGLIAHWDGIENAARGRHDDSATTWTDLVGGRKFRFDNGANVGETCFDMRHADDSSAGGCATNVAPLAAAIAGRNATIEIVCDFRALVNDGTLVAFCDGNNRLLWVRSNNNAAVAKGCVAVFEYLQSGFVNEGLVNIDSTFLHKVRTYEFVCSNDACGVSRNGEYLNSVPVGPIQPDVDNTWLSIGRKVSSTGVLASDAAVRIYAIRVYNRQLSVEEQQANAILDRKRFVEKKYSLGQKAGLVISIR